MILLAAIALPALVWLVASPRRAAFALGFAVMTNVSGVLEGHGAPPVILALCGAVIAACLLRWIADGWPFQPSIATLVGAALLTLIVVVAVAGPFVSDTPASGEAVRTLLIRQVIVLVAVVAVARTAPALRAALYGLVVGGTCLSMLTVWQMLTGNRGKTYLGFSEWSSEVLGELGLADRATGPLNDPNVYALYLVVALAAAVGLSRSAQSVIGRRLLLACAVPMLVAIFGTSSRTGLLTIGVVAVALALFIGVKPRHLAIGAVVVLAVVAGPLGAGDRLATLASAPAAIDRDTETEASFRGRTSEMLAAWRMFADHPVAGVGYGAYNDYYVEYARGIGLDQRGVPRSAHSLPLEIAAEQGLLGITVWGAWTAYAVVAVRRLRSAGRPEWLPLGVALIGFAFFSIFLHAVQPRLMWTLIGLTVGAAAIASRGSEHASPAAPGRDRHVVAMVIQNYLPAVGGAERQLARLVPLLIARGIDPVVITRSMRGQPVRDEIDGARVVRVNVWGPKPLRSLLFVHGARAELRELRPDVVHAYDTFTPSSIAVAHTSRHGGAAVTKLLRSGELGDLYRLAHKPFGHQRLERLVAGVDAFVVIASELHDELDRYGVPRERQVYIPNGVDTERFRPSSERQSARDRDDMGDEVAVVMTGRVAPEKRMAELAARWHALRTGPAPLARLIVVGDGPERARVEQFDGVEVLGWREDVADILRRSDVYVSASAAEGLSNSLLEAMACGLPCVVTDVGGVRDVITPGLDGLVVDTDDLDGLMTVLDRLIHEPERWPRLGDAARRRVDERYSLEQTANDLVALYHRLSDTHPHQPRQTAASSSVAAQTGRRRSSNETGVIGP